MSKVKGQNIAVLIKDTTWKAVAFATVCEVDESASVIDVGSATSGKWRHVKPKRKSWQVTSGHLLSNAQAAVDLESIFANETRILVAFCEVIDHPAVMAEPPVYTPDTTNANAFKRCGYCYITRLTVTARNRDYATLSVTFTGDGPLSTTLL